MIIKLSEASRQDLIGKYRRDGKKGNDRYQKRTNYTVSNFRGLNLDAFFNEDRFEYTTPIKDYKCVIEFDKPLTAVKDVIKGTDGIDDITVQMITEAFLHAYNRDSKVKVSCSCPDYLYRHKFWATKNGYNAGDPENRPSDITNPNDNQGPACKHIATLLDGVDWIAKAAANVLQFIKTYPEKAINYLYDKEDIEKLKDKDNEDEDTPVEETPVEDETTEEPEDIIDIEGEENDNKIS